MSMKGLQPSGIARRNKMIHAGIMLFLEKGYENELPPIEQTVQKRLPKVGN